MWRWCREVINALECDQEPLMLNLDETAVRFYHKPSPGMVIQRSKLRSAHGRAPRRKCTASTKRKAVTLVAVICNDSYVQAGLPQWILANKHVCPVSFNREPRARNVRMRVGTSAWVNENVLAEILADLANACRQLAPGRPCILLMDALKVHYTPKVLAAASDGGLHVVIVPACCTYFLQPLDTDAFSRFKRHYRRALYNVTSVEETDDVSPRAVVSCIEDAIRHVLQGHHWDAVFSKNGFCQGATRVRTSILRELEWSNVPSLPPGLPTLEEWQAIFPRNAWIPFRELFRTMALRYADAYAHAKLRFIDSVPILRYGSGFESPQESQSQDSATSAAGSTSDTDAGYPPGAVREPDVTTVRWTGPVTRSQSFLRDSQDF